MVKNILIKSFLMFFGVLFILSLLLPVKQAKAFEINSPELGMALSYGGNQNNLNTLKMSSDRSSLFCDITTNEGEFLSGNAKVTLRNSVNNKIQNEVQKNESYIVNINVQNLDVLIENIEFKGFAYPKPELTPKINGQVKNINCSTMKIW